MARCLDVKKREKGFREPSLDRCLNSKLLMSHFFQICYYLAKTNKHDEEEDVLENTSVAVCGRGPNKASEC